MAFTIQDTRTNIKSLRDTKVNVLGALSDQVTTIPSLSQEILNYIAPDNYEVYDCIIQIVRAKPSSGKPNLIAQFDFSILPESLEVPHKYRTQVMQTLYRNFVLDSVYEAPSQFTLSGNFGVNHKLVLNVASAERQSDLAGGTSNVSQTPVAGKLIRKYTETFVTGYGLCKRLEKLIKLSHEADTDTGLPYKTYLISRAFNFSMRVELVNVVFRQTIQKNKIWQYDLTLQKVADEKSSYASKETLWQRMLTKVTHSIMSESINATGNQITAMLMKYI